MNLRTVGSVYRKELREFSRDRRTILSMVVLPTVVIPLLFSVMNKVTASQEKQAAGQSSSLAVHSESEMPDLMQRLRAAGFIPVVKPDLRAAVLNKETAAALEQGTAPDGGSQIRVIVDRSRAPSSMAGDKLRAVLDAWKTEKIVTALRGSGISEKVLVPFTVERVNVAPEQKMAGMIVGGMLGYVVILLMFTGGMYPAIDMTAGEKERRTLEAVLCSPASRDDIVLGKIFSVATAAFITALLSIASLSYSLRFAPGADKMQESMRAIRLDGRAVALVLMNILPTAILAASLMVAIAIFAKSYKEGQTYLTPLLMLVLFPAIAGMLPGLELTPALAMIPIFNVCQIIKQILQGEFSEKVFLIALFSNLVYAGIAFFVATRVFQRESVLFRV